MIPASLIYVVSLVLTSFCNEYYQFFLAQAVLGGICLGLLFSTSLAVVGHYFNARQGLALGVVMAGAAVGGVIFPITLNRLLNNVGLSFGCTSTSTLSCRVVDVTLAGQCADFDIHLQGPSAYAHSSYWSCLFTPT